MKDKHGETIPTPTEETPKLTRKEKWLLKKTIRDLEKAQKEGLKKEINKEKLIKKIDGYREDFEGIPSLKELKTYPTEELIIIFEEIISEMKKII